MFGQDLDKLTRKEILTGIENSKRLNDAALEAFFTRIDDIEKIRERGPAIHSDEVLVKAMVKFTMQTMMKIELEYRLKNKAWKNKE